MISERELPRAKTPPQWKQTSFRAGFARKVRARGGGAELCQVAQTRRSAGFGLRRAGPHRRKVTTAALCARICAPTGDYKKDWRRRYFLVRGGSEPRISYFREWTAGAEDAPTAEAYLRGATITVSSAGKGTSEIGRV
jgi:hypothetical protein